MTLKDDIQAVSGRLDTPALLRYLIKDRFPAQTVVTASLRAPSIVVLKMVADIDPATRVVFCHRWPFKESIEYRAKIIEILGLSNVGFTEGHEALVKPGDVDHNERMWVHYQNMPGRSFQLIHLNECLAPYSCWISAVYHDAKPEHVQRRVDVEGRLIKVDPLIRWSKDDIGEFMRTHGLPYHKMAAREYTYEDDPAQPNTCESYHF